MFEIIGCILGPVQTNCYILHNQGHAVVIDPGCYGKELYAEIKQNELTIDAILLTHGHFDHIAGVNEIKELTDASVYVSVQDAEMLGDETKNFSEFFGTCINNVAYDNTIKNNDILDFNGIQLQVIETPGHSKGSVVFKAEDCLFTGDTLFKGSAGRTDLYGGSSTELFESLKLLSSLPGDYRVFPGHGESTTLNTERETNYYMGNNDDESDF